MQRNGYIGLAAYKLAQKRRDALQTALKEKAKP